MRYAEARKMLLLVGFKYVRQGRGSHAIFEKNGRRIVISVGVELSHAMTEKVRSAVKFGRAEN